MPYATVADLADRWRPLTDAEQVPAETLIGSAERLVNARVPNLGTRIAAGLDPLLVTDVVCEIVRRALTMRATGAEQSTVTTGQVTEATRYANPQGNLYITADEMARLSPGGRSRRAFSISTLPVA